MSDTLHALEPVGLEFLETAPVRFEYTAELPAAPDRVFAAISADPQSWTWFPGLTNARYESSAPHGVGTRRAVVMDGVTYRETILAWDAPRRWAYRVDESSDDTFHALVEDWLVEDHGDASVLRWVFAVAPRPDLAELITGGRELIGGVWSAAMVQLAAHLGGDDR